jgi:hypothetical protein
VTPSVAAAFGALIVAQAAHSVEEYVFRLYEVFAPARFVSALVSSDPRTGFVIANVSVVAFGIWCYLARVRPSHRSARQWVWGWVLVEGANGLVHLLLALAAGRYFPGASTAPFLLVISIYLGLRLVRQESSL